MPAPGVPELTGDGYNGLTHNPDMASSWPGSYPSSYHAVSVGIAGSPSMHCHA